MSAYKIALVPAEAREEEFSSCELTKIQAGFPHNVSIAQSIIFITIQTRYSSSSQDSIMSGP